MSTAAELHPRLSFDDIQQQMEAAKKDEMQAFGQSLAGITLATALAYLAEIPRNSSVRKSIRVAALGATAYSLKKFNDQVAAGEQWDSVARAYPFAARHIDPDGFDDFTLREGFKNSQQKKRLLAKQQLQA